MPRKNKKPKWAKPKLIVLVRGDRQERVLVFCKQAPGEIVASNTAFSACGFEVACPQVCFENTVGSYPLALVPFDFSPSTLLRVSREFIKSYRWEGDLSYERRKQKRKMGQAEADYFNQG